ncbi:MAG: MATE family efflux transporter [Fusicatenibacter sp.]|nr:MATE family efflux transporter [Fusicatenibacter sp.]
MKNRVCKAVLTIGIPASLGSLLMSISQIVVNSQMASFGDMAVAGIGVAMKVTMITGMICIGFGQGVQPLLGFCVGARLWERFKKIMRFSLVFSFALSTVMTVICYLFTNQIVSVFLTDSVAFDYAVEFTQILLTTSFLFGVFYVLSNALQAMGAASAALIINLSRQGIIYIPAVFLLKYLIGVSGLAWAQPVADLLSTILVIFLYRKTVKHMEKS